MARLLTSCLCAAVSATVLAVQDPPSQSPQQPTFRGDVQSVRVDLYATRDGKPVTDLRRDEIRLSEDGVAQTIQTFQRITFAAPTATKVPAEPRSLEDSRRLVADSRSRLFVLFLPTPDPAFDLGPIAEARRLFVEPMNDLLSTDDLIAVATPYTRLGDLTFRRRIPVNESVWVSRADLADPKHQLWDACYPPNMPGSPNREMKARHLELITFDALDALVDHLGGLREERKQLLLVTDGFWLYTENPDLAARGGQAEPGFPVGRGPQGLGILPRLGEANTITSERVRECEADLNTLASINHRDRLRELTVRATRNNVSFTPVSLAGLQTKSGLSQLQREADLRALAEDTGGVAIVGTNDIEGNLRRMMTATSAYYLLGYTPTNSTLDGKYRRITVRIDRPGVRVHARPGYLAASPADISRIDSNEVERPRSPVETAVAAIAGATVGRPLRVLTAGWTRDDRNGERARTIWIVGELEQPGSTTAGSARVAQITVRRPGNDGTISRAINLQTTAFDIQLDDRLEPGDYDIRVSVEAPGSAPIRDYVGVTLLEESTSLGQPIVLRRGPGQSQRYVRTASPQFRRNERLRVELPTSSSDTASATVRDSKGAVLPVPLTVGERPDESGAWRWITADVQLAPLAAAVYAIEVNQGTDSRVVAFRVVP